jgi:hypothetical protein
MLLLPAVAVQALVIARQRSRVVLPASGEVRWLVRSGCARQLRGRFVNSFFEVVYCLSVYCLSMMSMDSKHVYTPHQHPTAAVLVQALQGGVQKCPNEFVWRILAPKIACVQFEFDVALDVALDVAHAGTWWATGAWAGSTWQPASPSGRWRRRSTTERPDRWW